MTRPATRGPATRRSPSLYGALGCLGYNLAGLGAILPELRVERDLPRFEAGLYPSAFALGLLVVGTVGARPARWLGDLAVPVALAALSSGATLLAFADGRLAGGLGAIALGLGGAGLVQLVPTRLRALNSSEVEGAGDTDGTVAIGEANAVASAGSVLAPLVVFATLGLGLGWRPGFLGVPLVCTVVLVAVLLRPAGGARGTHLGVRDSDRSGATDRAVDAVGVEGGETASPESSGMPREFAGWWVMLVLAVGTEFCVLFWAADYLRTVTALPAAAATGASAGFVLGMAVGRATVGPAVRLAGGTTRLLLGTTVVAAGGFSLLWAGPGAVLAVAGLFGTGLGIALMYPLLLSRALASWPAAPLRAATRCALASGVAIGSAPVLLGALADAVGLRAAFLIVPVLLALLFGCMTVTHLRQPRPA